MDPSFIDALADSGMPLLSTPVAPPVTLENPSTLVLAVTGIATIALYWAVRRLLSLDKQPATVTRATQPKPAQPLTREAA